MSIHALAKYGQFEDLRRRVATGEKPDLARVFEQAVTDFRTIKRTTGHQKILEWCIDQGLDFSARAGWLNRSVVCLAAANGNNEIVGVMLDKGLPQNPFVRASVGDVAFLESYASRHGLSELIDENGFNLLFSCAASGLGRRDETAKVRLTQVCRLLLDRRVSPAHIVESAVPIFPAFLCAAYGGNEHVMQLLLNRGGLAADRFHLALEHALEPHQRSGEPFYRIAELILEYGFDINAPRPAQGRTLLHGSANRGTVKAVKWLLQHGANPNARDDQRRTPLHVCAERNTYTSVTQLLVDAGAELNARDATGKTPLDYARKNSRLKVVAYLVSVGGR